MYIYSGDCRLGTVGQPTKFSDLHGKPLFVGDIVITYADNYEPDSLTAVVSDEFTTYWGGEYRVKGGPAESFVMGIKSVDLDNPDQWRVLKVKDHQDVIDGEHWKAYGFNYSAE